MICDYIVTGERADASLARTMWLWSGARERQSARARMRDATTINFGRTVLIVACRV